MNKYLFIHKFQILKKYPQELANKIWQVLKIALPPKAIFSPSTRQKSHVKMASFKNCPHQKDNFVAKKNFNDFFRDFYAFFLMFFVFLHFFFFFTFFCILKKNSNFFSRIFFNVFCVFLFQFSKKFLKIC